MRTPGGADRGHTDPVIERRVVLGSDEGTIAIRSWDEAPLPIVGDLSENTLVQDPQLGYGELWVHSADQWGPFEVTTRVHDAAPGDPDETWEDVVEFSMTSSTAVVVTELVDNDPTADWIDGPGSWRVRVSARGRTVPHPGDAGAGDDDEESAEPVEWYLFEAWPASPGEQSDEPVIVRLTSAWAAAERAGGAPALQIPEGEAGLAAARRIGRDVDQAEGARELKGAVGRVEVARTVRGTRRRLFTLCSHLTTWSHVWLPPPSWSFSGGPGDELGSETWAYSHDHPDQLTGSTGAVRTAFVEIDKPRRAIRRWNWVRRIGDRGPSTFFGGVDVLASDSAITVSLEEQRHDGEPWTTITVAHDGLPVEWLDDMQTYWEYQLAISDHAGLGMPK